MPKYICPLLNKHLATAEFHRRHFDLLLAEGHFKVKAIASDGTKGSHEKHLAIATEASFCGAAPICPATLCTLICKRLEGTLARGHGVKRPAWLILLAFKVTMRQRKKTVKVAFSWGTDA